MDGDIFFGYARVERRDAQTVLRMESDGLFKSSNDSTIPISVEPTRLLPETSDFDGKIVISDGDLCWHILTSEHEEERLIWLGRLRTKSQQRLRGLSIIENRNIGLVDPLRTLLRPSGFRPDFDLDCRHIPHLLCSPEIWAYHECLIERWSNPSRETRMLDHADVTTVQALHGLCPLWSKRDAQKIREMVGERSIFRQVADEDERQAMLNDLLQQPRILSFRTFRTDCYLLETCAFHLKKLLPSPRMDTKCLRTALRDIYGGDDFEFSYLDLWLSMMRYLPVKSSEASQKELLSYLSSRARSLGFKTEVHPGTAESVPDDTAVSSKESVEIVKLTTNVAEKAASTNRRKPPTSMGSFYKNKRFYTTAFVCQSIISCGETESAKKEYATPLAVIYDILDCFGFLSFLKVRLLSGGKNLALTHLRRSEIGDHLASSSVYTKSSFTPSISSGGQGFHGTIFPDMNPYLDAAYTRRTEDDEPYDNARHSASSSDDRDTHKDGAEQHVMTGRSHRMSGASPYGLDELRFEPLEMDCDTKRQTTTWNMGAAGPILPACGIPSGEKTYKEWKRSFDSSGTSIWQLAGHDKRVAHVVERESPSKRQKNS